MTEVKTKRQSASLDRRKLLADPIMVTTIVVLIAFLTLFILYPLAILLVDSFYSKNGLTLDIFKRVLAMANFRTSIVNTLKVGFLVGILSTLLGLLFAYVEVYVKLGKFSGGLFKVVSMLPVVSPPFVLSLSMIMLFGKAGLITRFLLKIYDNNVYGFWGIAIVQTLTFFPVCYMMLKGLLKNIDPSLEEAARVDGARTWTTFWKVIFPIMKPMHATVAVLTGLAVWNDVMTPLVIMGGSGVNTLPLAQMTFQTTFGTDYSLAFASYLLAMLPMIIFYIFAQKQIIGGVTNGAVK